jgi:hypothetical protein
MMVSITLKKSLLLVGTCLISFASAINTQLVGTWSTKSARVLTGPVCFYSWNGREGIPNINYVIRTEFYFGNRDFTILLMTVLLSRDLREFPIRLQQMGIMRRHTTEQFRTIRQTLFKSG